MTVDDLHKIRFPVYVLHIDEVEEQDGLLFCDTQIVDDKNVKGQTIGQRRLKTPHKNLYKLKYMLEDFRSMVQHRGQDYVDTNGRYFRYQKTDVATVTSREIMHIKPKGQATLIWCKDVPFPFEVKRPPEESVNFAQILMYKGRPSVLWSFSKEKQKDTWRKV
tara:strand:- start:25 stop:513 length:489 start_codon:yes stop_codon:yes gene_type:complete